jgi:hypothetical protein
MLIKTKENIGTYTLQLEVKKKSKLNRLDGRGRLQANRGGHSDARGGAWGFVDRGGFHGGYQGPGSQRRQEGTPRPGPVLVETRWREKSTGCSVIRTTGKMASVVFYKDGKCMPSRTR